MKSLLIAIVSIVGLGLTSCGDKPAFKPLPTGAIHHHLIVVAKIDGGVKARGFTGATPAKTEVFCGVGSKNHSVVSNDDGSFNLFVADTDQDIGYAELDFKTREKSFQVAYTIKHLPTSLGEVSQKAFETEKEVDSFAFMERERVAILSSQAALVRTFRINEHFALENEPQSAVILNRENPEALGARMIAQVGDYLLSPLFMTHEIALIDIDNKKTLQRTRLLDNAKKPHLFDIIPPLVVKTAIDADGSGKTTTVINKSMAHNAEAIFPLDATHFLATYSNYFQFADFTTKQNSVVGPGIVALLRIENGVIKTSHVAALNFKNPQHFATLDNKEVWVTCTGDWNFKSADVMESHSAGIVKLKIADDFSSFSVDHEIDLKDFSPAEPVLLGNKIVIPRSWNDEVAVLDQSATRIGKTDKRVIKFHRPVAFTFASHWHDNVVMLGESQGSLIAFDLETGFFPFPFVEPIILNKSIGANVALTPIKVYFRHAVEKTNFSSEYRAGFDAWVITAVQRVYPLNLLSVFGP